MNWALYGLIGAIIMASGELIYKYKLNLKNHQNIAFTCILLIYIGICGGLYLICVEGLNSMQTISKENLMLAPIISALISLSFIFHYKGQFLVKNPTLLTVLYSGSKIITIFLISYFIFGDTLTVTQLFSVLLILSGILLLR
tara:strand:- start:609 stop:1034 length:426 start_codon:yes stop_codon:yes gene_type:complete